MKRILAAMIVTLFALPAFGQGKVKDTSRLKQHGKLKGKLAGQMAEDAGRRKIGKGKLNKAIGRGRTKLGKRTKNRDLERRGRKQVQRGGRQVQRGKKMKQVGRQAKRLAGRKLPKAKKAKQTDE